MGGGLGVRRRLAEGWTSPKVVTARLLPAVSRRRSGALGVLVLVTGLAPVAIAVAGGVLVGSVPDTVATGFGSESGHRAIAALAALGLLFALLQVGTALRVAVGDALGLELERQLEERVMRASMSPPGLRHLEDTQILDRISAARSVGSSGYRVGDAVTAMASRSATRLQGYGSASLLAGFRWWLAVGLAAAWGWAGREQRRSVLDTTKTLSRQTALVRRAEYLRDLAVTSGAAKELRVFGLGPWIVDRFRTETSRVLAEVWRERARPRRQWMASTFVASAAAFAALVLLGTAAVDGEIGIGALGLYAGAVAGVTALVHMGPDNHRLQYGTTAVPAVIELERLTHDPGPGGSVPCPPDLPGQDVRFEDVTFRYPGTAHDAVSHLDLVIPANRSTAIVGANGAGKTTLIKLLCRFYEPDTGRITADGQDVAELDPRQWHRRIAALFQDFAHYPLSARDNVTFGSLERGAADETVADAARRAGALGFLETLGHGLDTVLSSTRAGGTALSGGQWQRVGLARALYAVDGGARLLVLDEPAANLDVRAEAELYDSLLELTRGLTTVVISHRFSTVRRADQIVVFDQGRIVEQGGHDELVAADGHYAAMFRVQVERLAAERDG